ncbi:MAG TPA: hypothetical protein DDX04_18810, partial [Massilia sp.]|nr:hypothetical protein [Massilia sp.]
GDASQSKKPLKSGFLLLCVSVSLRLIYLIFFISSLSSHPFHNACIFAMVPTCPSLHAGLFTSLLAASHLA